MTIDRIFEIATIARVARLPACDITAAEVAEVLDETINEMARMRAEIMSLRFRIEAQALSASDAIPSTGEFPF
jgi:hypothetical protein